ncbi:putative polyvinyl alcohol dehydrogenase (Cytochrome) [Heracleum sosnowskyi]|uniref:Polyvinyl alcohol dehydrogenase (Cytochrome) n=1 Tax=Heracleum sosnowskyi TaxID=360622 RepID=A0AAD8H777_9APIA|nr:putative polyvinyl alcohol dehydrogenase (Cytochrome) [Heracleum sosnowskyi]
MAVTRMKYEHYVCFLLILTLMLFQVVDKTEAEWLNHGGDITNRRFAVGELKISPKSVKNLKLRWSFFVGNDISATPAIANGVVYFPSWDGYLYALNAFNGDLVWKQHLGQLTGLPATRTNVNASVSRTTPSVAGDLLLVGIFGPAVMIALERPTGQLVWSATIDSRPLIVITSSGTVHMGAYYVGVSWKKHYREIYVAHFGEVCPSIDILRGLVFAATGNLYTAPEEVQRCEDEQNNQTTATGPDKCIGPDVNYNSMLAFDMNSGQIRWSRQLGGYEVFFIACLIPNNTDCPSGPNLDADFGEAPMLLTIFADGRMRDVVVAVQKSGFAWALDRSNGELVWFKQAGPGGNEGGGIWGAATDGKTVFTNIANGDRIRFRLAPSNMTTTAGAWVALDANTGEITWTTANPSNDTSQGPVSLVNGVLFAGSVAANGPLYAMDANTGDVHVLWSYNTGATIFGGVSASYGCIYLGNGYTVSTGAFHPWTRGIALYAFCVI